MSHWIPVCDALPEEGAPVQFSFNERALVLRGVFRFGAFTSRWSRYLPVEISSWRRLEQMPEAFGSGDLPRIDAGVRIENVVIECEREEVMHALPAAFAPTWSQRPARI